MFQSLLITIENNSCIIAITRPDKLTALNKTVFKEQNMDWKIYNNPEIKLANITDSGATKAFVAGAVTT